MKLVLCKIKWFIKLRIWQKIKKYTWCIWKHNTQTDDGRCYPRIDIPEGEPGSEYWHCAKCFPCGIAFDRDLEKLKAEGEYEGETGEIRD
jgi:hypothetical protein